MVTNEWKELLRDHLTQTRCCPDCPVTFLPVNARVIDDIVNLEHFKLCLCCSIAKEFPQQQRANCQAGLWSTMWSPQARWDVDLIEVNPAPSLPLPPPRVPDFLGCFGRAVGYFIGCYHCGYHRDLTKLYVAASTVHLCWLCTVRAASQVYTCGEIDPCPPRRSTHRSWARWAGWAEVDFPRVSNLQLRISVWYSNNWIVTTTTFAIRSKIFYHRHRLGKLRWDESTLPYFVLVYWPSVFTIILPPRLPSPLPSPSPSPEPVLK